MQDLERVMRRWPSSATTSTSAIPATLATVAAEIHELSASIKTGRRENGSGELSLSCGGDLTFIGGTVYTFARVNAVLKMKVRDYFVQGRCGSVRLRETGGK